MPPYTNGAGPERPVSFSAAIVPEPSAASLMLAGPVGLIGLARIFRAGHYAPPSACYVGKLKAPSLSAKPTIVRQWSGVIALAGFAKWRRGKVLSQGQCRHGLVSFDVFTSTCGNSPSHDTNPCYLQRDGRRKPVRYYET